METIIIIITLALAFELYFVHTDAKRQQDDEKDNENDHLTPSAV